MILVDAHVVVWLALNQDQLSKKARVAIDDARRNGVGATALVEGLSLLTADRAI
jgi:PIN domain nuclease of toxin-antitoxin system